MTHGLVRMYVQVIIGVPIYLSSRIMQGVTGYEGAFRKSCEATMKVLRQDSDALIWYNNISWNFCPLNIFSMTYRA